MIYVTCSPFWVLAALKHPRTPPTNSAVDYPSGDSDHVSKRTRPMGISDEVTKIYFLIYFLVNTNFTQLVMLVDFKRNSSFSPYVGESRCEHVTNDVPGAGSWS